MVRKIKRKLATAAYTLAVTIAAGRWIICLAYLERGYKAYGGEYFAVAIVAWAAWRTADHLFGTLEELDHGWRCKKKRGRGDPRMHDDVWTVQ